MAINIQDKVGVGVAFPFILNRGGNPKLVTGSDLIKQSMAMILTTDSPTFFLGELKSKINELIFEQNDKVLLSLLKLFILDSLKKWEKKMEVVDMSFEIEDEYTNCYITFRILGEINTDSYVFPFYKNLNN